MVSASINHPCVIFHAFYNEGPSDNTAARPGLVTLSAYIWLCRGGGRLCLISSTSLYFSLCLNFSYNASASAIRSRVGTPPSRLVTWASDKRTSDVCFDIADVISFNAYPAWLESKQGGLQRLSTWFLCSLYVPIFFFFSLAGILILITWTPLCPSGWDRWRGCCRITLVCKADH